MSRRRPCSPRFRAVRSPRSSARRSGAAWSSSSRAAAAPPADIGEAALPRWCPPLLVALVLIGLQPAAPAAERAGLPPDEFSARRDALASRLGHGSVLLFGASATQAGRPYRQDNDFYYLTGAEAPDAVLLIDAGTHESRLFLPSRDPDAVRYEGTNWLAQPDAARARGFQAIAPLDALRPLLAARAPDTLWVRLSPRDDSNLGRVDIDLRERSRLLVPFAAPSEETGRAATLRAAFPAAALRDVVPALDRLRLIKSPREIALLEEAGRISALAMQEAIAASAPGRFEYEIEAVATARLLANGLRPAYPAIVASGPNGNRWHYEDNDRRLEDGDLVVMDYAGALDHLAIDLTRTWPVSGAPTDLQRRAYTCVLEAEEATIAAIAPGVTRATVQARAEAVFRRHGFDPRYAAIGHYVGLSVHDVGDWTAPFEAGMVLAVEPMIDLPDLHLHVRVEDTVLVTPRGARVLTDAVPRGLDALRALVSGRARPTR